MCDIATVMAIGTVTSTLGTLQSSAAASANAKFQQQLALDNASRTTEQMRDAAERGADEEQQVMREGAQVTANMRGALASNNMDVTYGSPLDAIIQSTVEVERDAYRVRRNTAAEIRDLETSRTNFRNSASARGAEASNARTAGFIAGVGTALSGTANTMYYKATIS